MSTHDLELALDMDRVLVVDAGTVVFDGGAGRRRRALPRLERCGLPAAGTTCGGACRGGRPAAVGLAAGPEA